MRIKKFILENKYLSLAFVSMGILSLVIQFWPSPAPPLRPPPDSVDTLIPQGYILVPLELENIEQLGSLIGNSAVVDLYTGGEVKSRKLIASRVKIIQAPFNPQVYAALVKESEGSAIQNYLGPFRAVIQNPHQKGAKVSQQTKKNFSITYQR